MVRNELLDKRLVPLLALAAASLVAGCGDRTAIAAPVVERTDSAGVEVVMSRGSDVPLDWRFEEVLRLGGKDDGPEAFYEIGGNVRVDAAGNLHVLDGGNHRIVVFAPDGRHLRTFGRRGGGPGEFEMPTAFGVRNDGQVVLYDVRKSGIVTWDVAGEPLESIPLDVRFPSGPLVAPDGSLVGTFRGSDAPAGMYATELATLEGDPVVLARHETPIAPPVQFADCPVLFPAEPRLLPTLLWDFTPGGVAVNDEAAYSIRMLSLDGTLQRVIRRDLPLREATAADAIAEMPDGHTLRYSGEGGSGECRIPAAEVVEKHGYAEVVPAIRALQTAPGGEIWVNRAPRRAERTKIDLISPGGAYLGTLPPYAPWPVAFTPGGDPIAVERDAFDLEYVVVYRVRRE